MTVKKVAIQNAVRPPAPTERVVAEVTLRHDGELKCKVVKIEYGEISGGETVGWRTILTGDDAVDFAAAWKVDEAAAVEDILKWAVLERQ